MRKDIFTLCFAMMLTISCVEQAPPPVEFKAAPEECPAACKAIEEAKCDLTGTDETCVAFCTRLETGSIGTYVNPKCQKTIKTCSDMDRCMAQHSTAKAGSPGAVSPTK